MQAAEKQYIFKDIELAVLLAFGGVNDFYGFRLPGPEETDRKQIIGALYTLSTAGYLSFEPGTAGYSITEKITWLPEILGNADRILNFTFFGDTAQKMVYGYREALLIVEHDPDRGRGADFRVRKLQADSFEAWFWELPWWQGEYLEDDAAIRLFSEGDSELKNAEEMLKQQLGSMEVLFPDLYEREEFLASIEVRCSAGTGHFILVRQNGYRFLLEKGIKKEVRPYTQEVSRRMPGVLLNYERGGL